MSTVAAPYGLRPVNLIGGQPYAGSTRMIPISSGFASNVFYGQPVGVASGVLTAASMATSTGANGAVGVFAGCSYTDPNLGYKLFRQSWPTGTVAADAIAYVVDDPDVVMQIQHAGTVANTAIGLNVAMTATTGGSTSTGNSTFSATGAPAVTATLPLRIVGFVEGPDSRPGDAFTDLLVKWNAPNVTGQTVNGGHAYFNPLGV
jgi:hypothetical protein